MEWISEIKAYESGSIEPGNAIYELVERLSLEAWFAVPCQIIGKAEGQEYDPNVLAHFKKAYKKYYNTPDAPILRCIVEIIKNEMGVD